MFTPREMLYINTFLEKEGRGIWYRWYWGCYELHVERAGKYVIEFDNQHLAIEFCKRIVAGQNVASIKDGVITIDVRNNNSHIKIKCGQNEELASKLTKHLRKQWVLIRRQQLKQKANQQKIETRTTKQEIEDIGIKF